MSNLTDFPLLLHLALHGRMSHPRKNGWGTALDDVRRVYPDLISYDGHVVCLTQTGIEGLMSAPINTLYNGETQTLRDVGDAVEAFWHLEPVAAEITKQVPSMTALLWILCNTLKNSDASVGTELDWLIDEDIPNESGRENLYNLPLILRTPLPTFTSDDPHAAATKIL